MITDAQMLEFAVAVSRLFEIAGIAVIILGTLLAIARFGRGLFGGGSPFADDGHDLVPAFRKTLGRSILTGLELLVAADIIRTVSVEPTLASIVVLGGIVLIRTFLSFSLEVEIDGKWPWQQRPSETKN
ncbi:DUF1622 domain-containing protein [Aurantiacibacter zhengii]|nr:DUF1622 domain-containing protein [Aurantiacibacter zhengii]